MARLIKSVVSSIKSSTQTKNRKSGFKRFVRDLVTYTDFTNIND